MRLFDIAANNSKKLVSLGISRTIPGNKLQKRWLLAVHEDAGKASQYLTRGKRQSNQREMRMRNRGWKARMCLELQGKGITRAVADGRRLWRDVASGGQEGQSRLKLLRPPPPPAARSRTK